jgi:cell division protein FtsB
MSRDNKSPTIDDTLEANINIKWLIQIVAAIVVAVWFYAELTNRLDKLEDQATINNIEIKQNSEFRIFWPRGTLGSLPDDAEQNMRLMYLERQIEKIEEEIKELESEK